MMPPGCRLLLNIPNILMTYERMLELKSKVVQDVSAAVAYNLYNDILKIEHK